MLAEASDLLAEAGIAHASIDLDQLGNMHPPQGEHGDSLMFANLAAVWPIYAAAGAKRLLVARVVEDRASLERYREAVPGAAPVVCLLTAPTEVMQERLRIREPGMFQREALARSAELADILANARAEDYRVDNGEGRPIGVVAREVLSRAGWL